MTDRRRDPRAPSRRWGRTARLLVAALLLGLLTAGCAGKKKRVGQVFVDASALYQQARAQVERRELRRARQTLERIRGYTSENRAGIEPLVRLMLADISFFQGSTISLIDARTAYLDFVTLYGDHPRAPYAQVQAGVCSLKQANHPSRDQTETRQAIQDFQVVLRRYPKSAYARAARDKIDEANARLAEHEFLVGRFYLKKKAYPAAVARFRTVAETYPRYPDRDKLFLHLGQALMGKGDAAEARLYLNRVIQEFPDSQWAGQATALLNGQKAPKNQKDTTKQS